MLQTCLALNSQNVEGDIYNLLSIYLFQQIFNSFLPILCTGKCLLGKLTFREISTTTILRDLVPLLTLLNNRMH